MPSSIAENAALLLNALYDGEQDQQWSGKELASATDLSPADINNAVAILDDYGHVEIMRFLGTAPFNFGYVEITPRGRFEIEKQRTAVRHAESSATAPTASPAPMRLTAPLTPVGSPFGFTDYDWEIVASRRGDAQHLNVVLGCQFESKHYETSKLVENLRSSFHEAVTRYNATPRAVTATLHFVPLHAGYGEHLFNEIARDIIAADIAVFDTSDLNPNVMLEMGVALTWGVRVLPVKKIGCAKPPSDVSGQTWADYEDDASRFLDAEHEAKLVRMVERAIRKKSPG
ncbi:MAG: hypothetical protein WD771_09235 [Gemmatimonadaceae bacterium]